MKQQSVELIRYAINGVVSGCRSAVESAREKVASYEKTLESETLSQDARAWLEHQRDFWSTTLAKRELQLAEALEALREVDAGGLQSNAPANSHG